VGDRNTNEGEEMSRIIIDNQSLIADVDAVMLVRRVMIDGLQSTETINGEEVPKYCHVTTYKSTYDKPNTRHIVYARPRKTKESAYSFHVYDIYAEEGEE
jgi:hypothetical protein